MFTLIDNDNDNHNFQSLTVHIENEVFAFDIKDIIEIIPASAIQIIGQNKDKLIFVNYRMENIPVYDLRKYFSLSFIKPFNEQKLLILSTENTKFALIIDNIGTIETVNKSSLSDFKLLEDLDCFATFNFQEKLAKYVLVDKLEKFIKKNTSSFSFDADINILKNTDKINYTENALLLNNDTYEIFNDKFFNEKYILFKLNNEIYSFSIEYIKEIQKMQFSTIIKVPCVPEFILGIINFRGNYISVIDIKSFLGLSKTDFIGKVNVVVLKINELKIAIIVDDVIDITNLQISQMNSNESDENSFIIGEIMYSENKFVNMLNVEKLFSSDNVSIEYYE